MPDGLDGLRVEFRMSVTHAPDQRFDVNGVELLQIRGQVIDSDHVQPEVVVRFDGQQQAQLYRWAQPGKHLSVVGQLEIKSWSTPTGTRIALLVTARDLHPLNPEVVDHSRAGIHAVAGRSARDLKARESKEERRKRMTELLDAG